MTARAAHLPSPLRGTTAHVLALLSQATAKAREVADNAKPRLHDGH